MASEIFSKLIDSVNINLVRAGAWHSLQVEREGGARCFPQESMNLQSAEMGSFNENAQTCRNQHPHLHYRIFQVFVCSCLWKVAAEGEAAAHSTDAVAVVHISCSTSVTGVCFMSEQVALVLSNCTLRSCDPAECQDQSPGCSRTLTLSSPVLQARWENSPSVAQTLSSH